MKKKPVVTPMSPDHSLEIWAWIIASFVALVCHRWIAALGLNIFTWGDQLGGDIDLRPTLVWAFAGIIPGSLIGAVVMARKYQLSANWTYGPVLCFGLLVIFVSVWTAPMTVFQPLPDPVVTFRDSTTGSTPAAPSPVKRKHTRAIKPDTASGGIADVSVPVNAKVNEQTEVSLHARIDSVTLHYRIQTIHNGAWSEWTDKFIPSAGQTLLATDDPIRVHAVEWWYETSESATRSAKSPFRKDHCDGALVVDIY